jgi:hypothetical protein
VDKKPERIRLADHRRFIIADQASHPVSQRWIGDGQDRP